MLRAQVPARRRRSLLIAGALVALYGTFVAAASIASGLDDTGNPATPSEREANGILWKLGLVSASAGLAVVAASVVARVRAPRADPDASRRGEQWARVAFLLGLLVLAASFLAWSDAEEALAAARERSADGSAWRIAGVELLRLAAALVEGTTFVAAPVAALCAAAALARGVTPPWRVPAVVVLLGVAAVGAFALAARL